MAVQFDNTYAALPERFFARVRPVPVAAPEAIRVNRALAERLGFDPAWLAREEGAAFGAGNLILPGCEPIAMVYGGHQFGNWAGRLGDGRAVLLGEVVTQDGARFDVQLKGSGPTPFSRGGDGRAPLGPVLREYIVSEAMAALGIPTTRALMATTSGELVQRQRPEPGGVLVRVASSHVRIGTFEYFAAQGDADAIQQLVAYVAARHYPDLALLRDEKGKVGIEGLVALLEAYSRRLAALVAQWQLVGFIHGVMNTDNMLLSGETIDYGPCAFMDAYDPATVFSSIDRQGRYAWGNQPRIAQWNLSRLAVALLGATGADESAWADAQQVIDAFPRHFSDAYADGMRAKLGLVSAQDEDWPLFEDLLDLMHEEGADYTLTFVRLAELVEPAHSDARRAGVEELGALAQALESWVERWRARINIDAEALKPGARLARMRAANPVVIPRNHRVNAAIDAAVRDADFSAFHALVDRLQTPFTWCQASCDALLSPPEPHERIDQTFCGT